MGETGKNPSKKSCLQIAMSPKNSPLILCATFLFGCQFQSYQAKPIEPQKVSEVFAQRAITEQRFQQFLIAQGYSQDELPLKSWDLKALTLCAHYFHPSLNVARAQWKAAQISEKHAAEKPLPTINTTFSRSNRANEDINPFAYQFSIDIPIETHNKRQIQIEGFSHLSEIAKLEIAQTAWRLRDEIATTLNEIRWNAAKQQSTQREISLNESIVDMLEKRKQHGLASGLELNQTKLHLRTSLAELNSLSAQKTTLQGQLAQQLGLPLNVVTQLSLNLTPLNNVTSVDANAIQKAALLNRLDVRIALEQYALAENKLKLEIAKQYPDITISPGLAYEFGDTIWSLGFSGLMTILQKNKAAIAEAEQLREVDVARFEALQARIMGEADLANTQLMETLAGLEGENQRHALLKQQFAQLKAQFDKGEIDRLTLTNAKLALENSEKEVARMRYALEKTKIALENTLQTPLYE